MAYPRKPCANCGASIPDRPDKKTDLCNACNRANRCELCGRMLGKQPELHQCASITVRGLRHCADCGVQLDDHNAYENRHNTCMRCGNTRQKTAARATRTGLIEQFGGECERCGYSRCVTALHFHHLNGTFEGGSTKSDYHKRGGASLREIREHPDRFQLVCANCHIEIHEEEREHARKN